MEKKKKICLKLLVIFVLFWMAAFELSSATNKKIIGVYEYGKNRNINITISKTTTNYFNIRKPETISFFREIADSIYGALIDSLNDYTPDKISNSVQIPVANIRAALNELKKDILNGTRQLKIKFYFLEPQRNYYKWLQKEMDKDPVTGKKYLEPHHIMKNRDVTSHTNYVDYFGIRNGFQDTEEKVYNTFLNGCEYRAFVPWLTTRGRPYNKIPNEFNGLWGFLELKTFLFKSLVFHELVHMALNNEKYPECKSRMADEATIEDIMLKIYPRNLGGANYYEYIYLKGIWYYLNKKEKPTRCV